MSAAADSPAAAPGIITTEQAAKLFKLTPHRVRQLIASGHIPKFDRNRLQLVGAVQGYIDFLRDENRQATKTASLSRVQDARARQIELRVAREANDLIPFGEVEGATEAILGAFRAELAGLPAAISRDMPVRRRAEELLNDALGRLSKRFDQMADDCREGCDPTDRIDGRQPRKRRAI